MDYVDLMFIYWLVLNDVVVVEEFMVVLMEVKKLGLICQIGIFNFIILLMECVIVVVGVENIVINQIEFLLYL